MTTEACRTKIAITNFLEPTRIVANEQQLRKTSNPLLFSGHVGTTDTFFILRMLACTIEMHLVKFCCLMLLYQSGLPVGRLWCYLQHNAPEMFWGLQMCARGYARTNLWSNGALWPESTVQRPPAS